MLTDTLQQFILLTTGVSGAFALVQGGIALSTKRRETHLGNMERRRQEVSRLLDEYELNRDAFEVVFDYASAQDNHLRTNNLLFTAEEMNTRRATDRCFEHLRNVHSSWAMGLIATADLGPWIYWVHRTLQRPCLKDFAAGCGYLPFVEELAKATQGAPDIACLEKHCPWWNTPEGPQYPDQRIHHEHGEEGQSAMG